MRHQFSISVGALIVAIFAATPARALNIIDVFDSSIANDPNHAQIQQTIQSASSAIASLYSNPVTVTINFSEMSSGLGASGQYVYGVSYAAYAHALAADAAAHPGNSTLATAVANLGHGNGANGSAAMAITSSQLTMLNQFGLGIGAPASIGGNISLNSSIIFWGSGPVPSNLYSGTGVVQHEIDEILGGGGGGTMLGLWTPDYLGSLDLYRYSAPGAPSLTTNPSAAAYFSIDGGNTNLVNFNQNGIGDFGDFTNSCFIQNWAACAAHTPENFAGSIEDTMLQSIGYDHFAAAVPAPLPGAGLAGLASLALAGLYVTTRRA